MLTGKFKFNYYEFTCQRCMYQRCEIRIFCGQIIVWRTLWRQVKAFGTLSQVTKASERFGTQFILRLSLAFRTESVEPMPQSKLAKFSLISAFEPRWMVNFEYVQHEHSLISDSFVVYSMYHNCMFFFLCVSYSKFYKILKIWEESGRRFDKVQYFFFKNIIINVDR